MNPIELTQAINEILQAANTDTPIDAGALLSRYPSLLEDETLSQLATMAQEAQAQGQEGLAGAFAAIGNLLMQLRGDGDEADDDEEDDDGTPTQTAYPQIEPAVKWAILVRQYIARQKDEYLTQALAAVENSGEVELVAILQAVAARDVEKFTRLLEPHLKKLAAANRHEEAMTLLLVNNYFRASLTESFRQYPLDQQMEALQAGMDACGEAIQLARALRDPACQALFLNVAAGGFSAVRQLDRAQASYQEALTIRRRLAQAQPQVYESDVAMTLNNLGNVQSALRELAAAQASYQEALTIRRRLAQAQPQVYESFVATTLNNLGNVQSALRELAAAQASYQEALTIRRRLAQAQPQVYESDVAMTLNNLGTVQSALRELAAAQASYQEALTIRRRLAQAQPQVYESFVATTLNNLGNVQSALRELAAAQASYQEALTSYRRLAQAQPQVYESFVATTLNNLGTVQSDLRELAAAQASYQEALTSYRRLAQAQPQVYESFVATTLNNLGNVQSDLRELAAAQASFQEALTSYRRLAQAQPQVYESFVATTLNNLGNVQSDLRELAAAQASFQEALTIRRRLAQAQPQVYESDVAGTLNNLGTVQRDLRELAAAQASYQEALTSYRRLAQAQPQVYESDVAMTLNNLGTVQSDLRELAAAQASYQEALTSYRRLAQAQPQVYESDVAMTLNNLGTVQSDLRELAAAQASYQEALTSYRRLAQAQPQVYESFVATTLNNLGTVQSDLRELAAAQASYQEALTIRRRLAQAQPQVYESFVATTLNNLGYFYLEKEDTTQAQGVFIEARELVETMRERVQDLKRRENIFKKMLSVYRGLLTCCIRLGDWEKALEIAEQGKSRSLSDLLSLRVTRPKAGENLSNEDKARLNQLADEYTASVTTAQQLENYLLALYDAQNSIVPVAEDDDDAELKRAAEQENRANIKQRIQAKEAEIAQARAKKTTTEREIQDNYDPNFPPRAELLDHDGILNASAAAGHTIVLFRVTEYGAYVFFIFPDKTEHHLEIKGFTTERLGELTRQWFAQYFEFLQRYSERREAETKAAFTAWQNTMRSVLQDVYRELLADVHTVLRAKKYQEALFIPSGALAILPLHAACWEENGQFAYLLDEFTISYATSVSVFKHAWELAQNRQPQDNFLFVTNPDMSLRFSDIEVDGIKATYTGATHKDLRHGEATQAAVINEMAGPYSYLHFSCHGSYNWEEPFSSPLMMADGGLTIAEIMQTNLSQAWLTTLSACETGLVDFRDASDEHYGFPLGFLFAGCPSIWGTLWSVSDLTSSALLRDAYRLLKAGNTKAQALRQAQIDFRNSHTGVAGTSADSYYSHPFFWAGFQHYGA